VELEARLGIGLPPSYRSFLRTTNGWRRATRAIDRLRKTHEVRWFRAENRDWIAAYASAARFDPQGEMSDAEYFAYGPQAVHEFRQSHLKETLQISDVGDSAVYLLNPQVISKDGEWEAWFLANWLPGIHRYRSFWELAQAEYHSFTGMDWEQSAGVLGKLPDEYVGSPGSAKRHRRKGRRQEAKALGRRLSEWTVHELLDLLRQTDVPQFREELAEILGRLGDPQAVDPLMAMVGEESQASVSAIYALRRIAPDRLSEPLLELLRKRHFFAFPAAATMLAEMQDDRAVPVLVEILKDPRPDAQHRAEYVGVDLARFREAGFDALVALLTSHEAFVRRRAARGLSACKHAAARDVFRALQDDLDADVRQIAEAALGCSASF
jgi:hypothetical protein